MSNEIKSIPALPDEIKDAVNNGNLAVFIGAGISRLLGCDGWNTLSRGLLKECHKKKIITFKEKETLLLISDHKKTITICYHLFKSPESFMMPIISKTETLRKLGFDARIY